MTIADEPKILAIADSDSYLKWVAGVLDDLPPSWHANAVLVRTPIAPSQAQIAAAIAGTRMATVPPRILTARRIRRILSTNRYDIVLLGATGPVVDVLLNRTLSGIGPRPAFVSGLPGISIPATERAVRYRSGVDLFVIHSRRELGEFKQLAAAMGTPTDMALTTLPSLRQPIPAGNADENHVVFATQALVPPAKEDRERILLALAELAERNPKITPIVKLRTVNSEAQTHRERLSYEDLWRGLARAGSVRKDAISFASGPMVEHLQRASGFVTVSSTAALEAIALGVPSIVLEDFGVSAEMINIVFDGSGLLGSLDDLEAARFRTPDPMWLRDNYFHPDTESDLVPRLADLAAAARQGDLPGRTSLMDHPQYAASRARATGRLRIHPRVLRVRGKIARRLRGGRSPVV